MSEPSWGVAWGSWLVSKMSGLLDSKLSRRSFIARTTLLGSAVAVSGVAVVGCQPAPYQVVTDCPGGTLCTDGYTEFCCTINWGVNACPPNTLPAGWWRADGSYFCYGYPRYYIDCNQVCCGPGYGNTGFCYGCSPCRCAGDCNTRRIYCNYFRYGQCATGDPLRRPDRLPNGVVHAAVPAQPRLRRLRRGRRLDGQPLQLVRTVPAATPHHHDHDDPDHNDNHDHNNDGPEHDDDIVAVGITVSARAPTTLAPWVGDQRRLAPTCGPWVDGRDHGRLAREWLADCMRPSWVAETPGRGRQWRAPPAILTKSSPPKRLALGSLDRRVTSSSHSSMSGVHLLFASGTMARRLVRLAAHRARLYKP